MSNDSLRAEAVKRLRDLESHDDPEFAHEEADKILCGILVILGYSDAVDAWERVRKLYA
jgi:hypothetical protein